MVGLDWLSLYAMDIHVGCCIMGLEHLCVGVLFMWLFVVCIGKRIVMYGGTTPSIVFGVLWTASE